METSLPTPMTARVELLIYQRLLSLLSLLFLKHPFHQQLRRLDVVFTTPGVSRATSLVPATHGTAGKIETLRRTNAYSTASDSRGCCLAFSQCGYGSIPINTIFSGMNIHLPAILLFTRGTSFIRSR